MLWILNSLLVTSVKKKSSTSCLSCLSHSHSNDDYVYWDYFTCCECGALIDSHDAHRCAGQLCTDEECNEWGCKDHFDCCKEGDK